LDGQVAQRTCILSGVLVQFALSRLDHTHVLERSHFVNVEITLLMDWDSDQSHNRDDRHCERNCADENSFACHVPIDDVRSADVQLLSDAVRSGYSRTAD